VRARRIGDATVTAIGSGDVSLATSASRGVAARDLEHAIHDAITFGITLFDVASHADSERLVGLAVREHRVRDRVVVATRVAILADRPELPRDHPRRDALPERLPPAYVQHCVEASLRATQLDALPLVQLALRPAWLASSAWPELVGTCARLVREGKVRAWAALVDDPAELLAPPPADHRPARSMTPAPMTPTTPVDRAPPTSSLIIDLHAAIASEASPPIAPEPPLTAGAALIAEPWLAALSVRFQACDRRAESVFAAAAKREPALAILARQPLAGGALAGQLAPGVRLTPRDDRNELDDAALTRIAVAAARLSALVKHAPPAARSCEAARAAAERAGRPDQVECGDLAELALRFAIDRAGIALPRLHRREHLLSAITAAAAPPLSAELAARIEADLA
jgi:aryl-alcohol dehydrogenase-like predicted oxidoreductase